MYLYRRELRRAVERENRRYRPARGAIYIYVPGPRRARSADLSGLIALAGIGCTLAGICILATTRFHHNPHLGQNLIDGLITLAIGNALLYAVSRAR